MKKALHLINGSWCDDGSTVTNLNPSTSEPLCEYPIAPDEIIAKAVASAAQAFKLWSNTTVSDRVAAVRSLVKLVRAAYGDQGKETHLKRTIMDEVGKPLQEADIELLEVAEFMDFFTSAAPGKLAENPIHINSELWPTKRSTVVRKPYGVVAMIKPWNYPLEMISWSLAPALLGGNTVVIKPSEKAPLSAYEFAKLIKESDIPDGVVNLVLGDRQTGQLLVRSPSVDFVSFTGSVAAGKDVASVAARELKPTSLELGGNDPALVLADADIETTSNGLIWGAICNAGQVCVGIKRAYIVAEVYDELIDVIVSKVSMLREGIDYGPIIDQQQFDKLNAYVKRINRRDGTILVGGEKGSIGFFYQPTVIEVSNESAAIFSEECFGPVLPLMKVETEDEAVVAANRGYFGLGASIWSRNTTLAGKLGRRLDCGMVWINDVNVAFPEAPWGGIKSSGVGFELSEKALDNYTYAQHINVETNDSEKRRPWWYPY